LRLPAISGQTVDLADFAGRAVLVNFWASWCTPCIEEMPSIRRLSEVMRDRPFSVLAVNVGEVPLRARTAAQRLRLTFPVALDQDGAVFGTWQATVLPTTYILDGDGVIRYVARGPVEWDSEQVVRLLEGLTGKAARVASPPPVDSGPGGLAR
jgi:peroxiredoxin